MPVATHFTPALQKDVQSTRREAFFLVFILTVRSLLESSLLHSAKTMKFTKTFVIRSRPAPGFYKGCYWTSDETLSIQCLSRRILQG